MIPADDRPRMLLVGGGGGLVGRAILREFAPTHRIRSVHRHPVAEETRLGVEWVRADVGGVRSWADLLEGCQLVVNLAWYRSGSARRFRPLADGLLRLTEEVAASPGVHRFVHLSVPDAPSHLEGELPYLYYKRRVDRAIEGTAAPYLILRPTMLFGRSDRLLTVMMRTMKRFGRFPMFGDGEYHVSPLASQDLAAIVRWELGGTPRRSLVLGGPERWRYRDLTDRMWSALGRPPRYWQLSPAGSRRIASLLEHLGSTLIYEYEVEWLLSDRLGPPPYEGLPRPLVRVAPFLDETAAQLQFRSDGSHHSGSPPKGS